jgi:beta-xylosidase
MMLGVFSLLLFFVACGSDDDDGKPNEKGDGGDDGGDDTDTYPFALREPIITSIFTADPSAHVFDGTLYVYPSHDRDDATAYDMMDYHVLSLGADGTFIDNGEILNVADVPWAKEKMWAPDAAFKNGTYYFYFPAWDQTDIFRIGVATSTSPTWPFTPEAEPIAGSFSMDPAVFVDDDGTAYMYFGGLCGGQLECWRTGAYVETDCGGMECDQNTIDSGPMMGPRVAKLMDDMKTIDGAVGEAAILDENGQPVDASDHDRLFFEGAWMHKYNGTYYLSYSNGFNHQILYATGDSPTGPFTFKGIVLPDHGAGWTTHHSIVEYEGKWYLFYHDNTCNTEGVDYKRCVKVADLHYNADGSIETVSLQ